MPVKITDYAAGDGSGPEATQFWTEIKAIVDLVNQLEIENKQQAALLTLHTTQIAALKAKVGG